MHYKVQADGTRVLVDGDQKSLSLVETISADTTLTAQDSGKTFLVATDALTITLPATAQGLKYTFMNSGADGNNIITVSPQSTDGISGTITMALTADRLDGTVDKDVINTKATSVTGDCLELVGTGVAGTSAWLVKSSTGIWAQEV